MNDKMKFKTKYFSLGIYFLSVMTLTVLIYLLSALPLKYELLLLSPFYVIFFLFFALLARFKKKWPNIITQILCIGLSICLFVGCFFLYRGKSTLDRISGANKKTYMMSVIVMNESPLQDISELADKTIEVVTKNDADNLNKAMDVIKGLVDPIYFKILDDYHTLVNNLYQGQSEAILINEAYRQMLEAEDEEFSDKTRVLWHYELSEDAIDVRKEVNVINTPFTVYISGIDTYGPISTVSRTDVNMLVTVNPNTKEVLLTSIPRDAWVKLTNMDAYDKLTHSGIAGIENSISTIENFMGIDINYYARVNFSSLVTIVDALGGIEVYNKNQLENYDVGYLYMDGQEALGFARERHGYDYLFDDTEKGDQMRVENQQAVVIGIINKMLSPTILTNYTDILDAIEGMFETNMKTSEITDLISMQLNDMASWTFVNMKVTGEYEYKYGGAYMPDWHLVYYIPNDVSVKQCQEAITNLLKNKRIS